MSGIATNLSQLLAAFVGTCLPAWNICVPFPNSIGFIDNVPYQVFLHLLSYLYIAPTSLPSIQKSF